MERLLRSNNSSPLTIQFITLNSPRFTSLSLLSLPHPPSPNSQPLSLSLPFLKRVAYNPCQPHPLFSSLDSQALTQTKKERKEKKRKRKRNMDPTSTPTTAHKPTLNGTLKRHQVRHPQPHPPPSSFLYRECLKNHAASLGGHALDGCGEYMPSSSFNPADPSSLTCAACGCHRNFHRRLHRQNHLPFPPHLNNEDNDNDKDDQEEEEEEDDDDDEHFAGSVDGGCGDEVSRPRQHPTSPPPPSAPHMLLALSTGVAAPARKRFRSKFSPEQKERMQELSERLRWRMQKRDEGLIAERCHEIGVGRGVFKVWMHNNKHNFNKQQQQLRSDDINGPPPPPSS